MEPHVYAEKCAKNCKLLSCAQIERLRENEKVVDFTGIGHKHIENE